LLQQAGCVLFSRTLALLLSAGIPIATGLPIVLQVIDNPYAQQRMRIAVLLVNQGHSFSYALQQTLLFPALALQMWKIGEHTGQLTVLLHDCALYYQQQLDTFTQQITQFIEPVLLIVLGFLIGSVVIAMYLPLFRLGLVMGG
jgi:type II secretory pathway component PulF